jgi:hypothetical protein
MLMEVIVKMLHRRLRQVITTAIAAGMLLSSLTAVASPALLAAPVAQTLQAEEVAGVLTGGEFAKIWLKLTPNNRGDNVSITTEWDRNFPESNGLGFFVLDQNGLSSVLNESQTLAQANLSAGSRPAPNAPDNQLGALVQATGGEYTIVLFNDSATDAGFTLRVTNGTVHDDANQVRDVNAAPTAASGEEAADAPATDTESAEATETPVPDATTATTADSHHGDDCYRDRRGNCCASRYTHGSVQRNRHRWRRACGRAARRTGDAKCTALLRS